MAGLIRSALILPRALLLLLPLLPFAHKRSQALGSLATLLPASAPRPTNCALHRPLRVFPNSHAHVAKAWLPGDGWCRKFGKLFRIAVDSLAPIINMFPCVRLCHMTFSWTAARWTSVANGDSCTCSVPGALDRGHEGSRERRLWAGCLRW